MAELTAGGRLRADMDAALAHASRDAGQRLEWSEQELHVLELAGETADRAAVLKELFAAEQDGENRPSMLVKISAEVRALNRQVVELVARVNPGVGAAKSARHVRAARSRWDRRA